MTKKKTIRSRNKLQKPFYKQRWKRRNRFYHNKASQHFFLSVAKRGNSLAGHDMTTHPSLNHLGKPKRKYFKLFKNPNPKDSRESYMDKKLRFNVKIYFDDSKKKRLTLKRDWKLHHIDAKRIKKLDKKAIKNPHNSI